MFDIHENPSSIFLSTKLLLTSIANDIETTEEPHLHGEQSQIIDNAPAHPARERLIQSLNTERTSKLSQSERRRRFGNWRLRFALKADGEVWVWGTGKNGEFEDQSLSDDLMVPGPLRGMEGKRITKIACSSTSSLFLATDGKVSRGCNFLHV
jgi:hypothetical protein